MLRYNEYAQENNGKYFTFKKEIRKCKTELIKTKSTKE
jgi:hypothetical protein